MPRIAAQSVLAAGNNSLPDYWEFFSVSKNTGEIDGIGAALSTIFPQHEYYLWWILELMRNSKSAQLETAPTGGRKCLFIVDLRINETLQIGAVGNSAYQVGLNAVRLGNRTYRPR